MEDTAWTGWCDGGSLLSEPLPVFSYVLQKYGKKTGTQKKKKPKNSKKKRDGATVICGTETLENKCVEEM